MLALVVMRRESLETELNDSRVPSGQSVTDNFPVLTYGPTPSLDKDNIEIKITGLVAPKVFGWEQIKELPQTTICKDFHCVTHWSKLDVSWTGTLTRDLLTYLEIAEEATHVMLHCYGGYTTNLSLEDFFGEGCMVAHALEGQDIPSEHGGPLRVIIPHLYAWKSAKWLSGIEFMAKDKPGFWERNGYHMRGDPFQEERFS